LLDSAYNRDIDVRAAARDLLDATTGKDTPNHE